MYRIAMRHIATLTALLLSVAALAQTPPASPAPNATKTGIDAVLGARSNGDDFLPADKAFRFDATADGSDRVRLNWEIADGYYLYRARIKVSTTSTAAQLGPTEFPPGQIKSDEYFGKQEVYHHELIASVPVARARGGVLELPLQVSFQGCAEKGLCYPPITKVIFPEHASSAAVPASHPWEGYAILGGGVAFLLAGLLLRKGRQLDLPAA